MKNFSLLLLFLLVCTLAGAQNFEGKIVYQNTFESKVPSIPEDQFAKVMGRQHEYYIKGGHYKNVMNGTYTQWQLYVPTENRLYSKVSTSDAILWNDAGIYKDTVYGVEVIKAAEEIQGYLCDEIILKCQTGIQKYYYNTGLGVDSRPYMRHKYGNWYDYLLNTHSVPLKIVMDNGQFTMTSTAIEVKPMPLDDTEFDLPKDAKTAKNPFSR